MWNTPSKASTRINIIKEWFQAMANTEVTELTLARLMCGVSQVHVCNTWALHLEGSEEQQTRAVLLHSPQQRLGHSH